MYWFIYTKKNIENVTCSEKHLGIGTLKSPHHLKRTCITTPTPNQRTSDLFLAAANFDQEVADAKVLQCLPVPDVLQLGVHHAQVQHGRMSLQDMPGNLRTYVRTYTHTNTYSNHAECAIVEREGHMY